MEELKGDDGRIYHIYTTPEFAAKLGLSPRTLVDWANRNHPAANWNPYRSQWEWIEEKYVQWKLEKRTKPGREIEPHAVQTEKPKRGPKPRFKVQR